MQGYTRNSSGDQPEYKQQDPVDDRLMKHIDQKGVPSCLHQNLTEQTAIFLCVPFRAGGLLFSAALLCRTQTAGSAGHTSVEETSCHKQEYPGQKRKIIRGKESGLRESQISRQVIATQHPREPDQ